MSTLEVKNINGIVNKPNHPVWHVGYEDGLVCTTAGQFYGFTSPSVYINQGGHFDVTNNYFTVPVTGMYFLYGSFLRNNNQSVFRGTFRQSGGSAISDYNDADEPQLRSSEGYSGYNTSATFNHVAYLTAGMNIVWGVSCDSAGQIIYDDNGGTYNFFGGYFIA